jgi:hypothetical protein
MNVCQTVLQYHTIGCVATSTGAQCSDNPKHAKAHEPATSKNILRRGLDNADKFNTRTFQHELTHLPNKVIRE